MEALGPKIRRQRRRLGLTLEELAGRTGISKPYLSLIETGRVSNPPSDEKLLRLEQSLGFRPSELLTQAHFQRTPKDVLAVLEKLMHAGDGANAGPAVGAEPADGPDDARFAGGGAAKVPILREPADAGPQLLASLARHPEGVALTVPGNGSPAAPDDPLDPASATGPAAGFVSCPDLHDPAAFAARVRGDSMLPRYREGDLVIFSPALPARDGDDCFVRLADGRTTFKRVFFEAGDDHAPVLRLQPRNERYRPHTLPRAQVAGLFRAAFRYERIDAERAIDA